MIMIILKIILRIRETVQVSNAREKKAGHVFIPWRTPQVRPCDAGFCDANRGEREGGGGEGELVPLNAPRPDTVTATQERQRL